MPHQAQPLAIVLLLFLHSVSACFPRCLCCDTTNAGAYTIESHSCAVAPPAGCVDMATGLCDTCTCCDKRIVNGALVNFLDNFICGNGPPSTTCNDTATAVADCLSNNCECCDMDTNTTRTYNCADLPTSCSTVPEDIVNCECQCWFCDESGDPDWVPYPQPCSDQIFDGLQGVPGGACFPEKPTFCESHPEDTDGPDAEGPSILGDDIGLLELPPAEDISGLPVSDCQQFVSSIGTTYCTTNNGFLTNFDIVVNNYLDVPNFACTLTAIGHSMSFSILIDDFLIGNNTYMPSCGCLDPDGTLHGVMSKVCVECNAVAYFSHANCGVDASCDDCKNGATCVGGYCCCAAGYEGIFCDTNIDDCDPNPCCNGGECTDGVNSFTCSCPTGFEGPTCGTSVDDCANDPCMHGGTCYDGVNTFDCRCPAGYDGDTCEIKPCGPAYYIDVHGRTVTRNLENCANTRSIKAKKEIYDKLLSDRQTEQTQRTISGAASVAGYVFLGAIITLFIVKR